jgi:DNA invertase Pin-like site-specific DNA recombinase
MAHARRSKATLVVAKLDRLSRNVAFLSALMESKVAFVCCDNPHATPLTVHIFAAVAQHEVEQIADRTRKAMTAAKARGRLFGSAVEGLPKAVQPITFATNLSPGQF